MCSQGSSKSQLALENKFASYFSLGDCAIDVRDDDLVAVVPQVEGAVSLCGAIDFGGDGEDYIVRPRMEGQAGLRTQICVHVCM